MKLMTFITAILITLLTSRRVKPQRTESAEGGRMKLMAFTIAILMPLAIPRRVTGNALSPLKEAA